MEKFLFILGKNWRLSLAELESYLQLAEYQGMITDYSANTAVVEFNSPTMNIEKIGNLMVRLGSFQKIGEMVNFIDRDTFENAFPVHIEENRAQVFSGRKYLEQILDDVIFDIFPKIENQKFFIANSIYPQAFNTQYYKEILVKHFLHYINKFFNQKLKEKGARKAIYFKYPQKNIDTGNLNPIFPHHFFRYQLYKPNRVELLYCLTEEGLYIGKTITVVDSNFQKQMDEKRPFTEFKQNIPPKFAKTLISFLALESPLSHRKIIDPFCGAGTIPQFAYMLGIQAYGADINPKFVQGTRKNLEFTSELMQTDISNKAWKQRVVHTDIHQIEKNFKKGFFDGIATEPVLLPFYHEAPDYHEAKKKLEEDVLPLYKVLFEKAQYLLKPNRRLALVSPIIETQEGERIALPVLSLGEEYGFKPIQLLKKDRFHVFTRERFEIPQGMYTTIYDSGSKYVAREFCLFIKSE